MFALNPEAACHWLLFAEDWRLPDGESFKSKNGRSALAAHRQAMAGLIDAQQEVALQLRQARYLLPSRQFSASFKITDWQPTDVVIQTVPGSQGMDYYYSASGRPCFKGSMTGISKPDGVGVYGVRRTALGTALTIYKLDQFRTLFPNGSNLWIFLSALTSAHSLWLQYNNLSEDAITKHPQLLSYKTQFSPLAIERAFRNIGAAPLSYSISRLSIGRYEAFSLGVYGGDTLLMRTELGVHKAAQATAAADTALH